MSNGGEICGSLCGGLCAVCAASAIWECTVFRACGFGDPNAPCCGGQRGCCPGLKDCCAPSRDGYRSGGGAAAHGESKSAEKESSPSAGSQTLAANTPAQVEDGAMLSTASEAPVSSQPQPQVQMQMSVPQDPQQTT
ncbi:hypothetical protein SCHPADRAFT_888471 [Schizopora paradoxa]|uniref:Granulins domain-containing protein n=1 Tax=Schizopora paradoxa TaxID=27342 RepID=A0A0H2S1D5_9AGAM|nr:hypothetical protein SCHPADRAFT_888471 [Schizopora paradoxa]